MSRKFIIDLIELPDFEIIRMVRRPEGWTAILEPKARCFLCPNCRAPSTTHKRSHRRQLRHRIIPQFGFIHVDLPVYHQQCTRCLCIWSVQWEGIPQYGKGTTLYKRALMELCHEHSIQSVSRNYDVPYTTLERWYYQWAEQVDQDAQTNRKDPTVVCLDDFALQKSHQYAISLVDYHSGEVCKMERGRSRQSIQQALNQWPYTSPEIVITDLANGMAKTVQKVWPKTILAADPFHIIQLFTREIDRFRKKVMSKGHPQRKRRQITRLLTTKPHHLTFKELFRLEDWLNQYEDLAELYQSLQGIRRIYAQSNAEIAEYGLNNWLDRYLFCPNKTMHRIAKTILQWRDPLINAIRYHVSNGIIEGVNNKIKLIKRRAYGYRNLFHLELRVHLETASDP